MTPQPKKPRLDDHVDGVIAKAARQYAAYIELARLADVTKALSPPAAETSLAPDTPLSLTIWPSQ
ncbi:MAG: hypothetical protein IT356_01855 [Gemmatimonadaceae bacterium]|nr:hypothetical protein [Gemmatimonadaceae bacterium]